MVELFANSGDPDQMLCYAASDLGLHCLQSTLLGVSRLQWIKGCFWKHRPHTSLIFSEKNKIISTVVVTGILRVDPLMSSGLFYHNSLVRSISKAGCLFFYYYYVLSKFLQLMQTE